MDRIDRNVAGRQAAAEPKPDIPSPPEPDEPTPPQPGEPPLPHPNDPDHPFPDYVDVPPVQPMDFANPYHLASRI